MIYLLKWNTPLVFIFFGMDHSLEKVRILYSNQAGSSARA